MIKRLKKTQIRLLKWASGLTINQDEGGQEELENANGMVGEDDEELEDEDDQGLGSDEEEVIRVDMECQEMTERGFNNEEGCISGIVNSSEFTA